MLSVILLTGSLGGSLFGQSMLEAGAAAAGGSVGGVAGKKVSDGLSKILEKVDKQTAKAADAAKGRVQNQGGDSTTPVLQVGPGVPKSDPSNVPPPPPVHRASVHKPAPPPPAPAPVVEPPPPVPVAPPPPDVTVDDLKHVTSGMQRDELLKVGIPSSRITMFEEGHLLEIYRYQAKDTTVGVVRLTDGAVSNIVIR